MRYEIRTVNITLNFKNGNVERLTRPHDWKPDMYFEYHTLPNPLGLDQVKTVKFQYDKKVKVCNHVWFHYVEISK